MIIECKNYRDPNHAYNAATKQFAKYSQYGVPVIGCVRMADIEDVVAQVKAILESGLSGPEPVSSPAPSSTTPAIDLCEKRRVVKSTGLVSQAVDTVALQSNRCNRSEYLLGHRGYCGERQGATNALQPVAQGRAR